MEKLKISVWEKSRLNEALPAIKLIPVKSLL